MSQSEASNTNESCSVNMLKERYKCCHFRILIIGRANAGKTTILEKVCGVGKGTKPIVYDQNGIELEELSSMHLAPSMERGIHNIEDQITYAGSNFIFHDSQGFEAGDNKELQDVWKFIERRSAAIEVGDQLHAIWYCIPMDGSRPILSSELEFFTKGTGKVPLVNAFTKFDALVIQEYAKLNDEQDGSDRWAKAEEKADTVFQETYLSKVLNVQFPPKAYVHLRDMDTPEMDCSELTEKTADAIDDTSLYKLFVSTQMNNLNLCVKSALKQALVNHEPSWSQVIWNALNCFPYFWFIKKNDHFLMKWQTEEDYHEKWFKERNEYKKENYLQKDYDLFLEGESDAFILEEGEWRYEYDYDFAPIVDEILVLFGEETDDGISTTPIGCQILATILIIVKQAFWVKMKSIYESVMEALKQFKEQGNVEKVKNHLNSALLPSDPDDLFMFLYDQISHI